MAVTVVVNDAGLNSALQELKRRTDDLSEPLGEIGIEFAERVRQQFSKGADPYGNKWAALSEVTQAKDSGRRRGGEPLRDTGRLMASINSSMRDGGKSVAIGSTNVAYAGSHQFGARQGQYGRTRRNGPIPWGNIPARPFFPIRGNAVDLPDEWSRVAREIIADYITEIG
jgi:phage virion morphogenesis protein